MRTDILFAQPSTLFGISRLLDIFGLFDSYNDSPSASDADAHALFADWRKSGEDIFESIAHFEAEEAANNNRDQLQLFATE